MNWTKLSKKIHANAAAHGWWEEERSLDEICALIHSELSEALEEYRAGRPNVWYACGISNANCEPRHYHYTVHCCIGCGYRDEKPEGIAVELADAVIRILDLFGKSGIDAEYAMLHAEEPASRVNLSTVSFGAFVNNLHNHVALASILPGKEVDHLCFCIREIMRWGKWAGVDMPSIIQMKHDYNTTRDYRHGGKRL